MERVLLYNPAISTLNIGDEIILESICEVLKPCLDNSFVVNVSTHLPVSKKYAKHLEKIATKFVCGTNLLRNIVEFGRGQWDINLSNAKKLGPCVLIGVGWHKDRHKLTPYTRKVYKTILDPEQLHSVRDNYTKEQLNRIGIKNVVNTGCATMWKLTSDFCKGIPKKKASKVVFTLTDYNQNPTKDKLIIEILRKEYCETYIWLQGFEDYDYVQKLNLPKDVKLIAPSLKQYDQFLMDNDVDYIGTRLHGGIRALQHSKRTMILAVDGRATEKQKDFNLPVVQRNEINKEQLLDIIYKERITDIHIPEAEILAWKRAHKLE